MACTITAKVFPTAFPFDPPKKGGRVYGSVQLSASCREELAKPEVQFNESQTWRDSVASWLLGRDVYSVTPDVVDATGGKHGFATIESVTQVNANLVEVSFNVVSDANGAQSFNLKLKCRCSPTGPWTELSVAVSFTI
jgi:hypothetical protein